VITRAGYRRLAVRLIYLAVIFYLLFTYCFLITQCHGQDMFPAMKDGDLCVVFRVQTQKLFGEKIVADDIIAYQTDGKRAFGRVAAVGGDVVMLSDSGSLMVNGLTEGGNILFPTYALGDLEYPYRVPEGCVFVLGDYRVNTTDSRILGPIPLESVEGKLITILRRREL
jgi:signal peptidase I